MVENTFLPIQMERTGKAIGKGRKAHEALDKVGIEVGKKGVKLENIEFLEERFRLPGLRRTRKR